jgi:hypothetical protein
MSNANKREVFYLAQVAGYFRDLAVARGGTGQLRKALMEREYLARRKRNKAVKIARKVNR